MVHKAWSSTGYVSYCLLKSSVKFQGHTGQKISNFDPNWVFSDCNSKFDSLMAKKWCTCLLFFKVIRQILRSHGTKISPILTRIECFLTVIPVSINWWLWNDAQSLKQHRRHALLFFKVICQISRSCRKKADFDPNWAFPYYNSSLNSLMALK